MLPFIVKQVTLLRLVVRRQTVMHSALQLHMHTVISSAK